MGVFVKAIVAALPLVPRPIMRRISARYIAGETLGDALQQLTALAAEGHPGIIDLLGEDVVGEAASRKVMNEYKEAADAVHAAGLDAYVSIKPTHLGLRTSRDLALELYTDLARHCAARQQFMRVEMEDHTTTDETLWVFARLRESFSNVGIVLQSRLRRTPEDIRALPPESDVRMVKGIYLEPPSIAHTEPEPIRDAYVHCVRKLATHGTRLSLATHDEHMAERCFAALRELQHPPDSHEMQVLLGVREELWEAWHSQGHVVRVYVPYGPEWRAYSQRRMRKNPQILSHVMRRTFGLD
jgi:proline dehydrogenase